MLTKHLDIKTIKLEYYSTNCYVIGDEKNCFVIDPGTEQKDDLKRINDAIGKRKLNAIFLTHVHYDHIAGASFFDVPVYLSKKDFPLLNWQKELSKNSKGKSITLPKPIPYPKDRLELAGFIFDLIETPGHTPGGICIKYNDKLFTGDTLFSDAYGRTDVGGNFQELKDSLEKLSQLPGHTKIYPGHGRTTTLENELDWIKDIVSKDFFQ